jgi:MYXO-CTERM domain-containing protein
MIRSFLLAASLTTLAGGAQAVPVMFTTMLSGAGESPPTTSTGTGGGIVLFDVAAHTLTVLESFSGLSSGSTASHIHCCTTTPDSGTAAVATQVPTFSAFPLGVTSGTLVQTFDTTLASTYNPAFVTLAGSVGAAETMLFNGLLHGEAYLNIHTTQFPGGEISGFLAAVSAIPEPHPWALLLAGLFGAAAIARRRPS